MSDFIEYRGIKYKIVDRTVLRSGRISKVNNLSGSTSSSFTPEYITLKTLEPATQEEILESQMKEHLEEVGSL